MTVAEPAARGADAVLDIALQLIAGAYRAPGAELAADLAAGAVGEAATTLAEALEIPAPVLARPDLTTLQHCHVALFVTRAGGLTAPPYVGLAADGELFGRTAEALSRFYALHDIRPSPLWHDLPDHVSAVAEAGHLLFRAGRADAAAVLLTLFIAPWFETYAAAVDAADASGFYGPLTRFLRSVVLEVSREAAA